MKRFYALLLLAVLAFSNAALAQEKNKKPIVILISLDGFRYDYVERFQPENLKKFIENGVAAESMMPSFPSKTFPNHYTIATGMKPEHHGLVDNSFYDPEKNETYGIGKTEIVQDGTWYGGTPLWVLAEQNKQVAASYFFVGSEADVQGVRPSYYYPYDGRVSNLTRVTEVFKWLEMPAEKRPSMITLYFSDMDDIGHRYGPNNDEQLGARLKQLDYELGALFEGLKSYDEHINVIIVSDHGMMEVPLGNYLNLSELTEGIPARVVNNGALAHLYLENPSDKQKVIKQLEKSTLPIHITDVDHKENYQDLLYKSRIGDILIIPDRDYYLAWETTLNRLNENADRLDTEVFGEHGYSPAYKDMHAIFYANGPAFKSGMEIETFQNIHVYPLICKILGLPIPKDIDGKLEVLEPILK
ncbi:ectonucleotide pyrophosphatase/phosphodiesterase [Algoriphagus halophytocola]|uniref:Ectonucleotide pyrophosphatase/phosphodiesterase n=1 Tax=Algoriphagus halophytocola TaxID=2991499 RepID=A0ABY6MK50_9BACT|nr:MULTISPECIES: ectonucleotide pyrophosphatase/phosphodiesterase [unclassified Algoriphagus]UZD24158.1 ectonucleotide pyrophosphatase/phosphodiesterase [Algoriphagus sp. TR-M5]WBL41529.1 ectonucleotide pyrophosphatase/phosphodiesterase [Algoriphagus sp. TR-M9]